jgi:hypothetical protein
MGVVVAMVAGAALILAAADEARFRRIFGPALDNQVRVQRFFLGSRAPSRDRFIRQARFLVLGAGSLFLIAAILGLASVIA